MNTLLISKTVLQKSNFQFLEKMDLPGGGKGKFMIMHVCNSHAKMKQVFRCFEFNPQPTTLSSYYW